MFRPTTIRRSFSLAVASLFLIPCAFAQSEADQRNAIAAALSKRNFPRALELLRPALQKSPDDPQLWTMQAFAYQGEGHKHEALASFEKALTVSPSYIAALQGAIQIEYENASPKAIPLLKRILKIRPDDATSHGMLAVLEYQEGDCSIASVHFEKAGALFDSQPAALHAYATCLVKLQQFEKAAAVFQRTLALSSDDPRERKLLASVQLMAHQPKDAITTLEPLIDASNPTPQTLELAANAYEDSGDTEKAVASLRQAILLDPRNVNL